MIAMYVVIGIIGLVLAYLIGTYNGLVRLRQHVRESWSDIDTELPDPQPGGDGQGIRGSRAGDASSRDRGALAGGGFHRLAGGAGAR